MIAATFRKRERLCSKKTISDLFENGRSFFSYPFQVIWMTVEEPLPSPVQVAISVSKRNFKRAVKRNLVKRRIREAYRKNKEPLFLSLQTEKKFMVMMIIFKESSIPGYPVFEKGVRDCIERLCRLIGEKNNIVL